MSFFRKKKTNIQGYDQEQKTPVIRCSICTGEQTAGFQRKADKKFEEVMLIRSEADLEEFKRLFGITGEIEKIY